MGIFKKKEDRLAQKRAVPSDEDFDDLFSDQPDEARQREIDLRRARSRTVVRPIRKELRHSRIDGGYTRADEVRRAQKQLEEEKKAAAAKKKNGVFGRLFAKKEPENEILEDSASAGYPKDTKIKRNGITAEQIKKLRGISGVPDGGDDDEPAEEIRDTRSTVRERGRMERPSSPVPAGDGEEGGKIRVQSFMESVKRLSGEPDFSENVPPQNPDPAMAAQGAFYPGSDPYTAAGYPYPAPYPDPYYAAQGYAPYPPPYAPQAYDAYAPEAYPAEPYPAEPYAPRPQFKQPYPYQEPGPVSGVADSGDAIAYPPAPDEKDSPFAVADDGLPDETIATALSVAVGFIYWDEENRLVDRIITIRRLIRHHGDIIIDAFCHDIAVPRMIPFSRGVRLYDIQTLAPYEEPREFLLHRIAGVSAKGKYQDSRLADVLSVVRYDLAALAFAAKADFEKSDAENHLILKYISQRCPTIDFDEQEMLDYISMLVPDEQSFYESVDVIVKQSKHTTVLFAKTFLKLILSDGFIHENERELLAELLYILRLEGIDLNMLGLK